MAKDFPTCSVWPPVFAHYGGADGLHRGITILLTGLRERLDFEAVP
ncbi:hypothetical protein ACX8Z9_03380 [Arthrobacter halodurans]|uniref:Uncharacterized protein n=1 Tax=Arthrobacter halodurans TaxID=516699 RepID=A0ABV4UKJ6_9MICC